MANLFLYDNKLNSVQASLTASSASTTYPASSLYDRNGASPWRSADIVSAHTIVQDFGAATSCDMVALIGVNFTTAATVKIQANATDAWGGPSFDETITVSGLGTDPPFYNLCHKFASAQNFRYWRLSINDAANPDGFYEVGEWILGSKVVTATGQDFQSANAQSFPDPNVIHKTEWLQTHVAIRDIEDVRNFSLEWTEVTSTTRDQLRKLKRFVKNSGYPFVFVPDQTVNPMEGFYVRMTGDFEIIQGNPRTYTSRLILEEQARGQSLPASP